MLQCRVQLAEASLHDPQPVVSIGEGRIKTDCRREGVHCRGKTCLALVDQPQVEIRVGMLGLHAQRLRQGVGCLVVARLISIHIRQVAVQGCPYRRDLKGSQVGRLRPVVLAQTHRQITEFNLGFGIIGTRRCQLLQRLLRRLQAPFPHHLSGALKIRCSGAAWRRLARLQFLCQGWQRWWLRFAASQTKAQRPEQQPRGWISQGPLS